MTFDQAGRTLTGTDPHGIDHLHRWCRCGRLQLLYRPADMIQVIAAMKPYAKSLCWQSPTQVCRNSSSGKTVFDMSPEEFGGFVRRFVEAGVNLMGGCCGTSPAYIAQIRKHSAGLRPVAPCPQRFSAIPLPAKPPLPDQASRWSSWESASIRRGKRNFS